MLGMKNHIDISGSIEIREVDIAGVACIHICKLPLLHIHEVSFNLFVFVKSRKPSKFKLNFVYISIFGYHFG